MPSDSAQALADTRLWLDRAVIGLNLCPFAKAVHVKGQVHLALTEASDWRGILAALEAEASQLTALPGCERDTTLLVAPFGPPDFVEFAGLVEQGERQLRLQGLEGVLQLVSFHPRFHFAGTEPDDITNYTNRAPWPTLHLLREDSIDRAVKAFPDAADIYQANMRTLRALGRSGWDRLMEGRP